MTAEALADIQRSCASKVRYDTPEKAGRMAQKAKHRGRNCNLRVYPCPVCEGFHLTKRTIEQFTEKHG